MTTALAGHLVVDHVRRRLGVGAAADLVARPLEGGVSSDVWLVTGGPTDLVVKRALPRLRVHEEWRSTPERALTEAAAIRLAGQIRPSRVPRLVDVDADTLTIVMESAPSSWRTWKSELMAGQTRPDVASRLGRDLAAWHSATAGPSRSEFEDQTVFAELRVRPFYHAAAVRNPGVAPQIERLTDSMSGRRLCLVHGDFSPKNILVGETAAWVLDWEVAHHGDPTFDLAFLLSHLLLKSVHLPPSARGFRTCADAFLTAYRDDVPEPLAPVPDLLVGHIGCLLLARVDGKSPAEYLTQADRARVREHALTTLSVGAGSVDALWEALGSHATSGLPRPTGNTGA